MRTAEVVLDELRAMLRRQPVGTVVVDAAEVASAIDAFIPPVFFNGGDPAWLDGRTPVVVTERGNWRDGGEWRCGVLLGGPVNYAVAEVSMARLTPRDK